MVGVKLLTGICALWCRIVIRGIVFNHKGFLNHFRCFSIRLQGKKGYRTKQLFICARNFHLCYNGANHKQWGQAYEHAARQTDTDAE